LETSLNKSQININGGQAVLLNLPFEAEVCLNDIKNSVPTATSLSYKDQLVNDV
jgi:hypothetical protein